MSAVIPPVSSKDKSKSHSITYQLNPNDGALLLIDYLYRCQKINQATYKKIQQEYNNKNS